MFFPQGPCCFPLPVSGWTANSSGNTIPAAVEQVEYYLSPWNYLKDKFLLDTADPEGWISLSVVCGFRRMRLLSATDPAQVAILLRIHSRLVEVDERGENIRPRWRLDPNQIFVPPSADIEPVSCILPDPRVPASCMIIWVPRSALLSPMYGRLQPYPMPGGLVSSQHAVSGSLHASLALASPHHNIVPSIDAGPFPFLPSNPGYPQRPAVPSAPLLLPPPPLINNIGRVMPWFAGAGCDNRQVIGCSTGLHVSSPFHAVPNVVCGNVPNTAKRNINELPACLLRPTAALPESFPNIGPISNINCPITVPLPSSSMTSGEVADLKTKHQVLDDQESNRGVAQETGCGAVVEGGKSLNIGTLEPGTRCGVQETTRLEPLRNDKGKRDSGSLGGQSEIKGSCSRCPTNACLHVHNTSADAMVLRAKRDGQRAKSKSIEND